MGRHITQTYHPGTEKASRIITHLLLVINLYEMDVTINSIDIRRKRMNNILKHFWSRIKIIAIKKTYDISSTSTYAFIHRIIYSFIALRNPMHSSPKNRFIFADNI